MKLFEVIVTSKQRGRRSFMNMGNTDTYYVEAKSYDDAIAKTQHFISCQTEMNDIVDKVLDSEGSLINNDDNPASPELLFNSVNIISEHLIK